MALLLFAATFFYLNWRAKRRTGQSFQFKDWFGQMFGLRTDGRKEPTLRANARDASFSDGDDLQEILKIVEDIYHDVHTKCEEIRNDLVHQFHTRFAELQAEVANLKEELGDLKEQNTKMSSVQSAVDSSMRQSQTPIAPSIQVTPPSPNGLSEQGFAQAAPLSFQILDELQNGSTPREIARKLGITVTDVEMVQKIMSLKQ